MHFPHDVISKLYQRDGVGERDGQCDQIQTCHIFVARRSGCRTGFRVTTTININCQNTRVWHSKFNEIVHQVEALPQ